MARRTEDDTGSLDMLLDAMCNTFGGIMFVALLLCIMSNMANPDDFRKESSPAQGSAVDAGPIENMRLEGKLQEIEQTLLQVEQAIQGFQVLAEGQSQQDDEKRLEEKLAALRQQLALQEEDLKTAEERLEEAEAQSGAMDDEKKALQEKLAKAEERLQAAKGETEQEGEENQVRQKVRLPQAQRTDKSPVWIIMRGGKLLCTQPVEGGSFAQNYDTSLLRVNVGDDRAVLMPLPGKGILPGTASRPSAALKTIVNAFKTDGKHFASFAVYPDSFNAFIEARNYLTAQKVDYNWAPMPGQDAPLVLVAGTEFEKL